MIVIADGCKEEPGALNTTRNDGLQRSRAVR